jgi:hypothetical protein
VRAHRGATGYQARRADFPALHAEVYALRRQLKAPAVQEIILTEEFNAAVAQRPRLGVLGWNRNTVIQACLCCWR